MSTPTKSHPRTIDTGKAGEKLALRALKRAGYRVIATNFRARGGEIDIVAEHDSTIVFVEVKTRSSDAFAPPALAVNRSKREKLFRTAWYFLKSNSATDRDCRFDVVSIVTGHQRRRPKIEIIPNAFQVDMRRR